MELRFNLVLKKNCWMMMFFQATHILKILKILEKRPYFRYKNLIGTVFLRYIPHVHVGINLISLTQPQLKENVFVAKEPYCSTKDTLNLTILIVSHFISQTPPLNTTFPVVFLRQLNKFACINSIGIWKITNSLRRKYSFSQIIHI